MTPKTHAQNPIHPPLKPSPSTHNPTSSSNPKPKTPTQTSPCTN
jgi:hypothetical protein